MEMTEKCYCLEMFRKKDPNVQGECLKMQCGGYKIEERRKDNPLEKPLTIKELSRRKKLEKLKKITNEQSG